MALYGSIYTSTFLPYIHIPENTWKILRTCHKKGNRHFEKLAMMKKAAADSKNKGKKPGSTIPAWLIDLRERLVESYSD